jgi:hypothetical protein
MLCCLPRGGDVGPELCCELLNAALFHSLKEACVVFEQWCKEYNTIAARSSLGYRPSGPQTASGFAATLERQQPMQQSQSTWHKNPKGYYHPALHLGLPDVI